MATYHLRFLLQGVPDYVWFEVDEATQERLHNVLDRDGSDRSLFFRFDSLDGYAVVVATRAIQIVNYLWDFRLDREELAKQFWKRVLEEEAAYREDIYVYLYGRPEPIELCSSEPIMLSTMAFELEGIFDRKYNPFVSFIDEDDETVSIQANQVMMLVAPIAAMATIEEMFDEEAE